MAIITMSRSFENLYVDLLISVPGIRRFSIFLMDSQILVSPQIFYLRFRSTVISSCRCSASSFFFYLLPPAPFIQFEVSSMVPLSTRIVDLWLSSLWAISSLQLSSSMCLLTGTSSDKSISHICRHGSLPFRLLSCYVNS